METDLRKCEVFQWSWIHESFDWCHWGDLEGGNEKFVSTDEESWSLRWRETGSEFRVSFLEVQESQFRDYGWEVGSETSTGASWKNTCDCKGQWGKIEEIQEGDGVENGGRYEDNRVKVSSVGIGR